MNRLLILTFVTLSSLLANCQKDKESGNSYGDGPRTNVPANLQGNWMYGQFSMNEYWSQNPVDYLGNGFELAIAFKFNANGTYEQYFTSSTVSGTVVSYHQSVSKGTVEIDEATRTITTHANTAHYKKTQNGKTIEDRDLQKNELTVTTRYTYTTGTENNGTKAIYLKLNGTSEAIAFLQK